MGEASKIEWTHHTFNPWWGCVRVSPGCENCYAEAFAKRTGNKVWGVQAPRRFFGDKHWAEPLKWAEKAAKAGEKHRVFCASMADVFEDRDSIREEREKLWRTIEVTHKHLDWLLLTKRPENIRRFGIVSLLEKCWVGTTAEDQKRADERIPILLETPAAVRFVSAEPLLSTIDFTLRGIEGWDEDWKYDTLAGKEWASARDDSEPASARIDWVIVGSESGPGARAMQTEWARSIVDQCVAAGVSVFVKQIVNTSDRKGGNPAHWPSGNWPREFPR